MDIKRELKTIQMDPSESQEQQKLQVKDNNTLSINFYQSRRKWNE